MKSDSTRLSFKRGDVVLSLVGALVLLAAWHVGLSVNLVNILLMAYVPIALFARVFWATKKNLETGFIRRPLAAEYRLLLLQTLSRWAFLIVWLLALRVSIVPLQLGESYSGIWTMLLFVLGIVALLQLLPAKRILGARNVLVVVATVFFGAQAVATALPTSSEDEVVLGSPFRAEALVFQGGSSALVNHHFLHRSQRDALDIVLLKDGKLSEGDEKDLSSYGCFGQTMYAPAAGKVVKVVNDRDDMPIGKTDRKQIVGNQVVIEIAPERFVLLAHLKKGSAVVHEGDHVEPGVPLAQCGNSGNTTSPHLHLQVQNQAEFSASDLRTFPIKFRDVVRIRGDQKTVGSPVSVSRNDRLMPVDG